MFVIVARSGKLRRMSGIKSVYRQHEGGITNGESLIKYHRHRIKLWRYMSNFLDKPYCNKAKEMLEYHQRERSKLVPSLRQRIAFKLRYMFKRKG